MTLDKQIISHRSSLSKLNIEGQGQDICIALTDIVELINQIQSANTDNIAPLVNPIEVSLLLREDNALEQNQDLRQLAPDMSEDGSFLTPKVLNAKDA